MPEFGDGGAGAELETGCHLFVGGVAVAVDIEVEVVEIASENIETHREVAIEQIGFGEADLDRPLELRDVGGKAQLLGPAAEIALLDREAEDEAFEAGEAGGELERAGRPFFHVDLQRDPVWGRARRLLHLQLVLEEAQALDAIARALDLDRVEGVAFGKAELAADHLVAGAGVAVHGDALDIDARSFVHHEGDVHLLLVLVPIEVRADFGEGITQEADGFGEAVDGVLDQLGVVPVALFHGQQVLEGFGLHVADLAGEIDIAELVAIAFLDDVGDDEIAAVGREFGDRGDDAEVGIALGQVELPELLLIEGQTVGIIGVVGGEEPQGAGLAGHHLAAELIVGKPLVSDDVDLPDLGLGAFRDLENEIDPVLFELDDLGFDPGGEAAAAPVEFEDARDISPGPAAGEDLPRGDLDLLADLVFLDALGAFDDHPVDDRVFAHVDGEVAVAVVADFHVGEQFGCEQRLQRAVCADPIVGLAGAQIDVGADGVGLEALVADDVERADDPDLGGGGGCGGRCCRGEGCCGRCSRLGRLPGRRGGGGGG